MMKMEMRPVHRIPSLPIIDPAMMAMTSDDVYHAQRQEPRAWDGYTPEWIDGQNVWSYSVPDIPGSTYSLCLHSYIVQNGDWLTQLNLTILDNTQQSVLNDSTAIVEANDLNQQTGWNAKHWRFTCRSSPIEYQHCRHHANLLRDIRRSE